MAYEMYQRTSTRVETPSLSIVPDGRIALNAASARTIHAAGVNTVVLLYDRVARKIALRATHRSDKNGYAVTFAPDRHSATLRAKSFVMHIGWTSTRRIPLAASWDAQQKMLEALVPPEYLTGEQPTLTRKAPRLGFSETSPSRGGKA